MRFLMKTKKSKKSNHIIKKYWTKLKNRIISLLWKAEYYQDKNVAVGKKKKYLSIIPLNRKFNSFYLIIQKVWYGHLRWYFAKLVNEQYKF